METYGIDMRTRLTHWHLAVVTTTWIGNDTLGTSVYCPALDPLLHRASTLIASARRSFGMGRPSIAKSDRVPSRFCVELTLIDDYDWYRWDRNARGRRNRHEIFSRLITTNLCSFNYVSQIYWPGERFGLMR